MRFAFLLLLCLVAPASNAENLMDRISNLVVSKQPDFLQPDEAFSVKVKARDAQALQADFSVAPTYYMYRGKISFTTDDNTVKIISVSLPRGKIKHDPNIGDTEVYYHSFQGLITLSRSTNAATSFTLNAVYQGCSEQGLCYSPITKALRVSLPAVTAGQPAPPQLSESAQPSSRPVSEDSKIATLFRDGNFWLIISFFFGAGLLLSLTPCVFPMIPILSGIIVGRGHKITHMHGFLLSLAYVLGMAITYAVAGVAAGYSGDLLSNALQTPWVLGSFAAVFVLLALSMFGFYELQLPVALQSKLSNTSNRLHGGHLSGVFVMGALSAIIIGPCVAAPLAGALLYIGKTHDAVLGGIALFVMALGMGVPLLVIGASAGVLLPKAGAWMEAVKQFFGVMLLALAIWIIQPLLSVSVEMLLWAALLIFSAIYLRALDALPHNAGGWHKLLKGIGLFALLLGAAYLVGALSGANDILRPLGNVGRAEALAPTSLQFSRIKDSADLDQRIAQVHGKQFVMLDFYADWCISCKELERNAFSDDAVKSKLKPVLLLQADVTANSEADKALLKRFGLFGPPGILFFDTQGKEVADFRVTGYQDTPQFLKTLQNIGL
ncbi:MAG TPA: protein-disulfide reductase DsbD [Gallionella sp.]|nr:protein-disulfide reductase DsbD [Gallionella sp.]